MPEFYYDEDQSHVSCCQYENFDYLWSITFLCLLVKHWKEFIAHDVKIGCAKTPVKFATD